MHWTAIRIRIVLSPKDVTPPTRLLSRFNVNDSAKDSCVEDCDYGLLAVVTNDNGKRQLPFAERPQSQEALK